MDEFTSEEALDAASKIEHLLHTPFFGKPPCDSFAQAWATDEIRAKALEFVRDQHAEFHELAEYADKEYGWGVGLYGSRREGPAIYGSHGAPGVPLMPPALCPVMPGAEIPCDVRATRRYINGYDGEVFVQPAGSLMNLAATVPGLRVSKDTRETGRPPLFLQCLGALRVPGIGARNRKRAGSARGRRLEPFPDGR